MGIRSVLQIVVIVQLLEGMFNPCHATTFVQKTFEKAVADSEAIIHGTVGMTYSNFAKLPDGNQRLFTFTEMQVDEVLKGALAATAKEVILRELGGEKDGVGLQIPGAARFRRGEEVVVFMSLPPNSDGSYSIRGMMMGKYNLVTGEDGQPTLTGGRLAPNHEGHAEAGGHLGQQPEPAKRWTLAALKDLIHLQEQSENSVKTRISTTSDSSLHSPVATLIPSPNSTPVGIQKPIETKKGPVPESPAWNWAWSLSTVLLLAAVVWVLIWK